MNKDKAGQPRKEQIKKKVRDLRKLNYSYKEIADTLGISRQLAWYHGQKLSTAKGIDKEK